MYWMSVVVLLVVLADGVCWGSHPGEIGFLVKFLKWPGIFIYLILIFYTGWQSCSYLVWRSTIRDRATSIWRCSVAAGLTINWAKRISIFGLTL